MAKNKFTTFLAVLMTLIAAGGIVAFGASTDWFTNFDRTKENLTPTTSETTTEDTSNDDLTTEVIEDASSKIHILKATTGQDDDGNPTQTFTYEIRPSTAADKSVSLDLNWAGQSYGTITDYLKAESNTNDLTITITKLADFGKQAKLTITSNDNPEATASVLIDNSRKFLGFKDESAISKDKFTLISDSASTFSVSNILEPYHGDGDSSTYINGLSDVYSIDNLDKNWNITEKTVSKVEFIPAQYRGGTLPAEIGSSNIGSQSLFKNSTNLLTDLFDSTSTFTYSSLVNAVKSDLNNNTVRGYFTSSSITCMLITVTFDYSIDFCGVTKDYTNLEYSFVLQRSTYESALSLNVENLTVVDSNIIF